MTLECRSIVHRCRNKSVTKGELREVAQGLYVFLTNRSRVSIAKTEVCAAWARTTQIEENVELGGLLHR